MKRGTGKAQCICPAHVDTKASLTLTDGNDRALISCHAGCSAEKVVDAAGLKMSDLFYGDGLAKERWRAYIENREKRKIEAVYNYASINGDYAYTKVRLEGKKMLFGILSNERFAYGLNGKNKKTFNAVYGSISSIKRAIERKEPVFIPEGEKDVNTLVKKGYTAFSCGGANDWNKNVSELCKDADVIVLADNDDPGKKLASTVVRDLKGTAKSIKIIIPMPEVPKADITDYFEAGHTVEELENLIRNVDDTEKVCTDVQQDQKQDIGKKRSAIQKSKDEVAGGLALVFKFLDCNYDEDGNVKSVKQLVHNFEVVMDKDSRFAGKIRLNEFAQQPYLYGSVPWENENNCRAWSSHDDSALFSLIQADYGLKSRQDFADALKNVSMRNKFHPVRELLDSLTWDGKEHIRSLLPECLGAEDSDYTYQVMRLWMLGAVSRVYKPGNKFDYTMILQGSQGIGKSTLNNVISKVNGMINNINSAISGIERGFTFSYNVQLPNGGRRWGNYSMSLPRVNSVPYLASGAVIPPKSEFLAVLGDQKKGNNLETPESLLRQIVREESGKGQNDGNTYNVTVNASGRKLLDIIISEAEMRRNRNGKNPFELV